MDNEIQIRYHKCNNERCNKMAVRMPPASSLNKNNQIIFSYNIEQITKEELFDNFIRCAIYKLCSTA
jgi:hypothetical protein